MEYGIFNDEGCVERDFYSKEEAARVMARDYADDGCHVGVMSRDQDGVESGYEDSNESEDDS